MTRFNNQFEEIAPIFRVCVDCKCYFEQKRTGRPFERHRCEKCREGLIAQNIKRMPHLFA